MRCIPQALPGARYELRKRNLVPSIRELLQALPDARRTLHCAYRTQKARHHVLPAPRPPARCSCIRPPRYSQTGRKAKTRRIPGSKAPGTTAQAMLPADTTAAWYVRPVYRNIRRTEYLLSVHRHSNHNKSQSAPLNAIFVFFKNLLPCHKTPSPDPPQMLSLPPSDHSTSAGAAGAHFPLSCRHPLR